MNRPSLVVEAADSHVHALWPQATDLLICNNRIFDRLLLYDAEAVQALGRLKDWRWRWRGS